MLATADILSGYEEVGKEARCVARERTEVNAAAGIDRRQKGGGEKQKMKEMRGALRCNVSDEDSLGKIKTANGHAKF